MDGSRRTPKRQINDYLADPFSKTPRRTLYRRQQRIKENAEHCSGESSTLSTTGMGICYEQLFEGTSDTDAMEHNADDDEEVYQRASNYSPNPDLVALSILIFGFFAIE